MSYCCGEDAGCTSRLHNIGKRVVNSQKERVFSPAHAQKRSSRSRHRSVRQIMHIISTVCSVECACVELQQMWCFGWESFELTAEPQPAVPCLVCLGSASFVLHTHHTSTCYCLRREFRCRLLWIGACIPPRLLFHTITYLTVHSLLLPSPCHNLAVRCRPLLISTTCLQTSRYRRRQATEKGGTRARIYYRPKTSPSRNDILELRVGYWTSTHREYY